MDIAFRKLIYKLPLVHELCKQIVEFNSSRFYRKFNKVNHHDFAIRELKASKSGKRCFIVGNGPSLTVEDLELIENEDCFAANLIFRIFPKTSWRPTYYFLQDRYADTGHIVDELNLEHLFIGDYYWRTRGMDNANALCFHCKRAHSHGRPEFSEDISRYIVDSFTVTYSMIQTAAYLGYKEIYLLGIDHNYALVCDANGNVVNNEIKQSHFFEDGRPDEVIANLEGMNRAYIAARDYAETHGISIVNCTRGGKLEWYPRKSLESVLTNAG